MLRDVVFMGYADASNNGWANAQISHTKLKARNAAVMVVSLGDAHGNIRPDLSFGLFKHQLPLLGHDAGLVDSKYGRLEVKYCEKINIWREN